MDTERIFAGLNPEQKRAVEAVRGSVCILAGAGSGKTTTITRRIAYQVASGAFEASAILAVTFTDKAASELRARLAALGVQPVAARTFHSAALAQLRALAPDPPERILPSKAFLLRSIGNSLPRPFRFRPAGDLATEIEWAKNRRLTPETYLAALDGREPPLPAGMMQQVFAEYERRKSEQRAADFEDLLELAIRLLDEDEAACGRVRSRYRAFTVDEYQDVNLLQEALLERWLGAREEICVVGDDYQSIYGFTGASPDHLLSLPARFPSATIIRLESNYRSTPQILGLANRLVPRLGGAKKVLRAARGDGPEPVVRACGTAEEEAGLFVGWVRRLHEEGVPHEEMAVLCRTNARLADFEVTLHEARIPVQGAALLARQAARMLIRRLAAHPSTRVGAAVRRVAEELGWQPHLPDRRLGERELTRQQDLARLVALAREFDDGKRTTTEFLADLERRFGSAGGEREGVHLLTLHGAKGLEFEAVFIPRVEQGELPIKLARAEAEVAVERRLFYVAMTRAKRHLKITWIRRPSRFLDELGVEAPCRPAVESDDPRYAALKSWRRERAKADELPAYVVFHNTTLEEIVRRAPRTISELASVPGVGPAKLERYGADVLSVLSG